MALAALDRTDRRIDDAIRRLAEARDVAESLPAGAVLLSSVLTDLAILQIDGGRCRSAVETASNAVESARNARDSSLEVCACVVLALALIKNGDHSVAETVLNEELERVTQRGDFVSLVGLLCVKGKLLSSAGRNSEATATLYAAVDAARASGISALESQALSSLLEALESVERASPGRIERILQATQDRPTQAIRRTPANELVFSGDVLPPWTTAKRTLERFILENALRQTRNNRAAAGRILKITKVAVHHACLRHGFGGVR
jgi:hypothetical protein